MIWGDNSLFHIKGDKRQIQINATIVLNFNLGKSHSENRVHHSTPLSITGPAFWLFIQGLPMSSEESDKPDRPPHKQDNLTAQFGQNYKDKCVKFVTITILDFWTDQNIVWLRGQIWVERGVWGNSKSICLAQSSQGQSHSGYKQYSAWIQQSLLSRHLTNQCSHFHISMLLWVFLGSFCDNLSQHLSTMLFS